MELKTKNKKIELIFTTRKIVNITNILKEKNFEDLYFKAMNEKNLDSLSKIIYTFAEDIENGAKSFKTSEEVYDFLDNYKKENNKSYEDIFREIAEVINEEGFFNTKMSKKDFTQKILNPLSIIDMNSLMKESAEKAMTKIVEQEAMQQAKSQI